MPPKVAITLKRDALLEAATLAAATIARWKGSPGYYPNTLHSHRMGKLGELACERWLTTEGVSVDPAFRDPDREGEADLLTPGARLEVKTWSERYWATMGRCVRPPQLPTLVDKADRIAWPYADERPVGSADITIAGWSFVADIAELLGRTPQCSEPSR